MTTYYITYGILSVLLQITSHWFNNFKGSSRKVKYQYLGVSMAIGFLTIAAVWICSFFILQWWLVLVLIAAYYIVAPTIGLWVDYISPFWVKVAYPALTVITAVIMAYVTYKLMA